MTLAAGLVLALVSTAALNWGFVAQHHAASALPPLRLRAPVRSLALLVRNRAWLLGFTTGIAGWGAYVAAVALAPLSLVQAVAAGGVGAIALFARRRGASTSRRETIACVVSVAGLVLLAATLGHGARHDAHAALHVVLVWIALSVVAGLAVTCAPLAPGAGLGAAAGVLYAAGDVATKGAVTGTTWLALVPLVLACHGAAFAALQLGFQRGSALATAGLSSLLTNSLPIVAGVALFAERIPSGVRGDVRIASFALVVAAAALLGAQRA